MLQIFIFYVILVSLKFLLLCRIRGDVESDDAALGRPETAAESKNVVKDIVTSLTGLPLMSNT